MATNPILRAECAPKLPKTDTSNIHSNGAGREAREAAWAHLAGRISMLLCTASDERIRHGTGDKREQHQIK